MRGSLVEVYVHLVWGTHDRHAYITPDIEENVYNALTAKCSHYGCAVLAIGGTFDHVHLLIRTNGTLNIPAMVRDAKGMSSHLITAEVKPNSFFRWQGGYGAFSVDRRSIDNVIAYIKNQKKHHAERTESQYLEYYLTAPDSKPGDKADVSGATAPREGGIPS